MKKIIKILTLALVLVMILGMFAACGIFGKRLSGVYTSTEGTSYTFDGKNFSMKSGTVTMKGTYVIEKIDEDYRIFLTIKEEVVDTKTTKLSEEEWYVLGEDDGVEFLERTTDDGTRFIKIDEKFYYEVK